MLGKDFPIEGLIPLFDAWFITSRITDTTKCFHAQSPVTMGRVFPYIENVGFCLVCFERGW
jgi:hypothetical protein